MEIVAIETGIQILKLSQKKHQINFYSSYTTFVENNTLPKQDLKMCHAFHYYYCFVDGMSFILLIYIFYFRFINICIHRKANVDPSLSSEMRKPGASNNNNNRRWQKV